MNHAAPIARLALAFAAGLAVGSVGAPTLVAPLLGGLGLALPILASLRPWRGALLLSAAAGSLVGASDPGTCLPLPGEARDVRGHFLATPVDGSAPFRLEDGCGPFTVVLSGDEGVETGSPRAGDPVRLEGRWEEGRLRPWMRVRAVGAIEAPRGPARAVGRAVVRWRDGLVQRLPRLYGERAPLVAALVFARREGMDRDVREAFAVAGIAHLLAISGFHVGVVAGLALALLRGAGVERRRSALVAAGLSWGYVGFIGFPDAACRAAVILALVAVSRARGRPPARWGALAAAGLVLLVLDPSRASSAGFQLSFAGAAGLVAWAGPLGRVVEGAGRGRLPRGFVTAVAAGVAATVATVPIVAWHFERVSLVGIPVTLVASPLVSLALPGALASIALDPLLPAAAAFLAGGVDVLLMALVGLTDAAAAWPLASTWVARPTVVAGVTGVAVATWIARRPGIGGRTRRRLVAAYAAAAVAGWPVAVAMEGRGTLEFFAIDVGQGDAVAMRTPRGRWLLVDAGPPFDGPASGHPAVRALRERGVRRLELLVLTHPDADHFGGAHAVLTSFRVGQVADPLLPAPKAGYATLLEQARADGVPWTAAREGASWNVDGVDIEVLHPPSRGVEEGVEANDASVVLLVRWGDFEALLTGDADAEIERALAPEAGDVDMLKVGHHGSRTSTDPELLRWSRPEFAIISAGRRNRYGHPHGEVLRRLEGSGVAVLRTDVQGSIRLLVDRRGEIEVRTER